MSSSTLSVQLYTVREAIADDLPGTLARLAQIGFRCVEVYDVAARPEEYRLALAANGLTAPSAHARLIGADTAGVYEAARSLGVRTVIDPGVDATHWTTRADIEASAAELNQHALRAANFGLQVGYHNHWWELDEVEGETGLELFVDRLDEAVLLEVDTYWAQVAGVPAVELLGRLGERVRYLHVKDGPPSRNPHEQTAVGEGTLPIREILAAAPSALRVVELDEFDGDIFDAVADSFQFLTELGERA